MSEVADRGREERESEPAIAGGTVDLPRVLGVEGTNAEEILRRFEFVADAEELAAAYRRAPGAGDEF